MEKTIVPYTFFSRVVHPIMIPSRYHNSFTDIYQLLRNAWYAKNEAYTSTLLVTS